MKVCIVSTALTGGGAERFTANLANSFDEKGIETYVLTGPRSDKDYQLNSEVTRIDILKGGRWIVHDIRVIRKIAKEYRFDVIIGVDLTINTCVSLANIGFKPKIIISERSAPMSAPVSVFSKLLRTLSYPLADGYVFQTKDAMRFYSNSIQSKSVIILNPLKEGLPYKNDDNKAEIIAIGRLNREKNYDLLINAFSQIVKNNENYVLRIFGDGDKSSELKELVRRLDIEDKVIFEGFCEDPHSKIVSSDIYVLTSLYEGLPNSLMEAMAMGFPVISTDCPAGGPAELIKDKNNGLLIKNNNLEELTEAIDYLIHNPEMKKRLGKNAAQIRAYASKEVITEKWISYITTMVKG